MPVKHEMPSVSPPEFTTLTHNNPLVERFLRWPMVVLLMIGGKCSLFASKSAHISGHLPAAPEVEQTYNSAWQLCAHLDNPHQLFPVLLGLWIYYLGRVELQTARILGEQLLDLAQRAQDTAMLVSAYRALGSVSFYMGAVASA